MKNLEISFEDIVGQEHLIGENGPLKKMVENNNYYSIILHGPSGTGKTTLVNALAKQSKKTYFNLNAATSNKKELAEILKNYNNLILIIDEFHRLDKSKQDFLLPFLEKKDIQIFATTTENPIFAISAPVRSRMLIFEMELITHSELEKFLITQNTKYYPDNILDEKILSKIITSAGKDLRKINSFFNFLVKNYQNDEIDDEILKNVLHENIFYNFTGDEHYNLISAFQKSIRASDVNASLYYLARLLFAADYEIIFRRLTIIAYEDIGLANSNLVTKVNNVIESFKMVGMPEGRIILANYVVELALSPKSRRAYQAINMAMADVQNDFTVKIPEYLWQNQPKGKEYDMKKAFFSNNLPSSLKNKEYLQFSNNLSENEIYLKKQYDFLKKYKNKKEKNE